jgi:OmpA-OmpF porin, OOP family
MKKRGLVIGLATWMILVFFTGYGSAEITPGAFTVSPMAGSFTYDDAMDLDEQNFPDMYSLGLGYNINENWTIEGLFSYAQPETEAGKMDVDVYRYELDALLHLAPEGKLVPYLAGGIGLIEFDPEDGKDDTNALLNFGGGVKLFLDPSFALRADIRNIMAIDDFTDFGNQGGKDVHWAFSFGGTIVFGAKKEPMPAPPPPAPMDSDGDGVLDNRDKCPDTPGGCPVDANGCPLDGDGDGVIDCKDKCPDTPKGCPVDAAGCALDSDGDGVIDCRDQCPGTPKGASVDMRGCWVISGSVLFGSDSSELKPAAKTELDNVFGILFQQPAVKIEIQGYTDSMGPAEYNQKLSNRRAEIVKMYFIEKGISSDRLSAVGMGENKPVAPNDSPEGRAKNRRVEFNTMK